MIREMRASDVPAVTEIHLKSFKGFFLSYLGPRFLRLLFESLLADESGIALVAEDEGGRLEAFVLGVTHQEGFFGRLIRKKKWQFALAASGAVVRRPMIAPRLLRALGQARHASESSASACLMSLAVSPGIRRKGQGTALVLAFANECRSRGERRFCLTTDADGNEAVNEFYSRLGFSLARHFVTPEGRWMNEYLMRME